MAAGPVEYASCGFCTKMYQDMVSPIELSCYHILCWRCLLAQLDEACGLVCLDCGKTYNATMIAMSLLENEISRTEKNMKAIQNNTFPQGSARNFAVNMESYASTESILCFLIEAYRLKPSQTTAIRKFAANSHLQLLIHHISVNFLKNLSGNDQFDLDRKKQIWRQLMDFQNEDLIKHTDESGQSVVSFATFSSPSMFDDISVLKDLMTKLSPSSQIDVIKQLQSCNCNDIDDRTACADGHKITCTKGYNLFMLTLSSKIIENIDFIFSIVKQASQPDRSEIVLRGVKPGYYVTQPNSLRVAAMHDITQYLQPIHSLIPIKQQSAAYLETDGRIGSALGQIFQGNNIDDFGKILKSKRFALELQRVLKDNDYRRNFEQIEAPLKAIQCLSNNGIPQDFYYLPPWSGNTAMSRHEALIFYNTFKDSKRIGISDTEPAIVNLEATLLDLGWEVDAVKLMADGWTFEELKEKMRKHLHRLESEKRTSLFLLCITSHGEDEKILALPRKCALPNEDLLPGKVTKLSIAETPIALQNEDASISCKDTQRSKFTPTDEITRNHGDTHLPTGSKQVLTKEDAKLIAAEKAALTRGDIDDILQLMHDEIPKGIPKVVILDVCRGSKSADKGKLISDDEDDTLYLLSTRCGCNAWAGLYIQKLTEQMALANGRIYLSEMHKKATVKVRRDNSSQRPQCIGECKRICLNRLPKKKNFPETLIYSNAFDLQKYCKSSVAVELRNTLLNLGWPLNVIQLEGKGHFATLDDGTPFDKDFGFETDLTELVNEQEGKRTFEKFDDETESVADIDFEIKLVKLVNQLNQEDHALLLCLSNYGRKHLVPKDKPDSPQTEETESDSAEHCGSPEDISESTIGQINQIINTMALESTDRPKLVIVEIVKPKGQSRQANWTKEYIEKEKVLFLKGDGQWNTVNAEIYLEKLTKQIEQADGETKLLEMHANAGLETALAERERVRRQVSSRWREKKSYIFHCANCQKHIEPTVEYIPCRECSNFYHLGCTDFKKKNLETLKVKGVGWQCGSCQRK